MERIRRVRLMGLLLAGVEDIVEAMPKAVGRVEEKADPRRIAPKGARCVRPIAAVGIQRRRRQSSFHPARHGSVPECW